MNKTPTQSRIEDIRGYVEEGKKALEGLEELRIKLVAHTGKLVDKRFFLEHFKVSNEYRDWTRYEIRAPRYSFASHAHEMYITQSCTLELENRETSHIIAKVEEMQEKVKKGIAHSEQSIKNLESFDESALVAELRALFFKHGEPETWGKILDSYEVKYPQKD